MIQKFTGYAPTQIVRKPEEYGASIEEQIRQATASKEPIDGSCEVVYTALKDGVLPQYDIRTDRQEIAIDATDKLAKSDYLKSDERPIVEEKKESKIETTELEY